MNRHLRQALGAAALAAAALPAAALDATWSGYATLGYARSDSAYTYQRFINEDGTFKRDSLVAGQLDLRLTPQWSATVQAKLAPADDSDSRWSARTAWAFVAWRPDNDWLVRAGKVRVPLYLYSESLDVGVATDMARLPHEMYSISPTNDFTGLFVSRAFGKGLSEFNVDAYMGRANTTARFSLRDGQPPFVAAGPYFRNVNVRISGLTFSGRDGGWTWRAGVLNASTGSADGRPLPVRYPRVDIAPGLGYWQVDDALPGPGIERVGRFRNRAFTAGVEWQIDENWRIAAEGVRMRQLNAELGSDSKAGYVAVFRRFGDFTPYVSVARQRSNDVLLEWNRRLTQEGLPGFIPGAAQINAAQRIAGETQYAFDQRSVALGMAYAVSPTAKLKAEWMRTHVGQASNHFDPPPGQPDAGGLKVNTLSLNFSVAF